MDEDIIIRIERLRRLRSVSEGYIDSIIMPERRRWAALIKRQAEELQCGWVQPKVVPLAALRSFRS